MKRTFAVAGSIAALSLVAAPIASASPDIHKGPDSKKDRSHQVEKKRDVRSRDLSRR
jgi:hypothetical protein